MIVPIIDWGLRKLSYLTYNIIVYHKLDINESSVVSLGYWILCVIYVLILYGVVILSDFKNFNNIYCKLLEKVVE